MCEVDDVLGMAGSFLVVAAFKAPLETLLDGVQPTHKLDEGDACNALGWVLNEERGELFHGLPMCRKGAANGDSHLSITAQAYVVHTPVVYTGTYVFVITGRSRTTFQPLAKAAPEKIGVTCCVRRSCREIGHGIITLIFL